MTIACNGMQVTVELTGTDKVRLIVESDDDAAEPFAGVNLDANTCEAVETLLKAARMALHARAVGP